MITSIYFVQSESGGPIKIGFAIDVSRRLRFLQCGSPTRLSVLATAPGDATHESALHRKFRINRVLNEWFSPSDELLDLVASVRRNGALPLLAVEQPRAFGLAAADFLGEVCNFIAATGLSDTAFGRAACADGNFVADLRRGRSPNLRTIEKVRAFIATSRHGAAA